MFLILIIMFIDQNHRLRNILKVDAEEIRQLQQSLLLGTIVHIIILYVYKVFLRKEMTVILLVYGHSGFLHPEGYAQGRILLHYQVFNLTASVSGRLRREGQNIIIKHQIIP